LTPNIPFESDWLCEVTVASKMCVAPAAASLKRSDVKLCGAASGKQCRRWPDVSAASGAEEAGGGGLDLALTGLEPPSSHSSVISSELTKTLLTIFFLLSKVSALPESLSVSVHTNFCDHFHSVRSLVTLFAGEPKSARVRVETVCRKNFSPI
jgi:hypothetical protein